ncbi:xylose isomerase-like TIM barrel protein [Streptomyces sp. KhCrAH-43]|uniref:metabolite traffic protein EboE n=1 Tax=unclassified Streptomyces TaxID=2593676 RepID=UPI000370176A|nr:MULTISPECIES: metabolite traffic protein EboE [unclassified Streptomyces]MYS35715.1 metabolite traffic protein EboE [Streptomyces sp. SID4920]MYX68792.1 metabolite traffic protein EboE [Streptomyces sp. SID8373]RAJ54980.1 xylose isomerase-like TIM barrel protein [Streptomyces sp. KhCrAH-43]
MRFRHPDGTVVHLAYCTNVHPAETLDGVRAQLRDHCEPVRKRLGRDRIGIGLWLARGAARTLVEDPAQLRSLRTELDRRGLEVVTLNGFPYEGFGAEEVKYRVYKPDWTDPERLTHTTDLARLLGALLPDDVTEGTISTLPLAWRTPYTGDPEAERTALEALTTLGERLDALAELTEKSIRIGLEPEPGCTVETTADAIAPLTAVGHPRIGVCVDTCHLATSFEDPDTAMDALTEAGIPVVKAQLSAALHAEHPHLPEVRTALAAFAEPRFLHQTRTATAAGLRGTDDLDEAVTGEILPDSAPWRAHFHVPLHAPPAPPLTSTLPVLRAALARLVGGARPLTRHLEVETYTWQALPAELRPRTRGRLTEGIAAELALARDLLTDLGLKELP